MTSFQLTYILHNQMATGHMPVHWIQWTNQMSSGHVPVHWIQWTTEMSNGRLKCPLDICISNGSTESNGPLDILPLHSHWPATCMG
jgi:hypothetical protein